jgi:hypothetical protein
MNGSALFFSVGLLVLLGVFVSPTERRETENFWRARRDKTIRFYRGESRPKGYRTVKLQSQWPSTALLCAIAKLGYPKGAIFSSSYFDENREENHVGARQAIHPEHPYLPATPELRGTTTGGGFHAKTITRAIERVLPGIPDAHAKGVYEVIVLRRKPYLVAASLGVKVETLYTYKNRVIRTLRSEGSVMLKPEKAA